MAMIGLRYVVAAKLTAHTDGSEPTYGTSGSGIVAGGAINANLTITRNTNELYYDDVLGESDNSITSMQLELGLDDLLEATQEYLLGTVAKTSGSPTVTTYYDTSKAAPYVGIGYIRVRKKNGAVKYQAVWYFKVQFGLTAENSTTKGESIQWQTPTITGKCAGLYVDSSGDASFRKKQVFDTEADAKAWLKGLANVT